MYQTSLQKLNNETESKLLEGRHREASLTLKNMKNNKNPGSSGYTPEFFKCFWEEISYFVVRAINKLERDSKLVSTI